MSDHLLVVDDDPGLRELLADYLGRNGFRVTGVADGRGLWAALEGEPVDLVILDLMLPGLDGLSVMKRLRADTRTANIPVIMLTARSQVADKIAGLDVGVDDYLTKPFSPRELFLRISAILRRTKKITVTSQIRRGPFTLDRVNLKVYLRGTPLDLTTTEFKFLSTILENPDAVHTRAELLRDVWGYSADTATRTLDTHVKRLREKLGDDGASIVTVRGTGFQFQVPSDSAA